MANPVVHWEIGGRDMKALRQFYGELFGWEIEETNPEYGLVPPAEGGIGGGLMQVSGDIPPHVLIYVQVPSLENALARAEELGGHRAVDPTPIPGVGSFALFNDPEGNLIGLMSPSG